MKGFLIASVLIAACAALLPVQAKDVGIFVNGGYGAGETEMNDIVRGRIDKARDVFDHRHPSPGGESHRADSRDELESQLRGLNCGAGDNITITLMGHGNKERFAFSLEANSTKRTLTPEMLCEWIGAAAKDPKCCVRIVMFACHSGSWIEKMSACPNVWAIYTSSRSNEKSYSDVFFPQKGTVQDTGDWLKGFNEDWEAAPAGIDTGDELDMATESAWDKMPVTQSGKQHPTGWRRGEQTVLAHVEQPFGTNSSKAKLHFWSPVFMRCKVQEVGIDRATVNVLTNYKACEWITFKANFGASKADGVPTGPLPMTGPPSAAERPPARIVAHVIGMDSKRKHVRVHTIEPNWMYCKQRDLSIPTNGVVDPAIRPCNWIQEDVTVVDPDGAVALTDGSVGIADVTVPVLAHVEGTRQQDGRGQLCLKIQEPSFLANGQNYYVLIPKDQLNAYRECEHVRLKLHLNTVADGVYRADDITKLDQHRFLQSEYDLSVDGIGGLAPRVSQGTPIAPVVNLRNAGRTVSAAAELSVVIRDIENQLVFEQKLQPSGLAAGEGGEAIFPAWMPPAPGPYRAVIAVNSPDDLNPENDSVGFDFVVEPPSSTGGIVWQGLSIGGDPLPPVSALEQSVSFLATGKLPGGAADQLSFAFQQSFEDFGVSCVLSLSGLPPNQSAGLMFRAGPDAPAPCAALYLQAGQLLFAVRPAPGAPLNTVATQPPLATRIWLGLARRGNQAVAEYSLDGWNWVPFGNFAFGQGLPRVSFVGLMASSPTPALVRFDDVAGFPTQTTATPRPREFIASPAGPGAIALEWKSDALTNLGFLLERAVPGQPFQALTIVPPGARTYTDKNLPPATEFAYRIRCQGYYPMETWAAAATAETPGIGLATWATMSGVVDPFAVQDGVLPVERYAIGNGVQWWISEGGQPRIRFERQPGTQDVSLDWQTSRDLREWVTLRTAGPGDASGLYEFVPPELQDYAFFRPGFRSAP